LLAKRFGLVLVVSCFFFGVSHVFLQVGQLLEEVVLSIVEFGSGEFNCAFAVLKFLQSCRQFLLLDLESLYF
jgi:hypothetical protein